MIKVWNIKALCNWNLWHSWQGKILGQNFSKYNSIQTLKPLYTIGMKWWKILVILDGLMWDYNGC